MKAGKDELDELFGPDDDDMSVEPEAPAPPADQEEIDELFGGASDDEDEQPKASNSVSDEDEDGPAIRSSSRKDIKDVFGDSDDDAEPEDEQAPNEPVPSQMEHRDSKLDQILGRSGVVEDARVAQQTVSLVLPASDKIQPTDRAIFLRTPNFVKLQTQAFDKYAYNAKSERQQFDGAQAVIRWKVAEDGQLVSNARLLKWSDGSCQLVVGDSVFKAMVLPTDNCYVYESVTVLDGLGDQSSVCFECLGPVPSRMTVQPSSLDSETHTRMSLQISERHRKEKRITVQDYEKLKMNPEKALHLLARQEEDAMRKARKLRMQQQEMSAGQRMTSAYNMKRPSMSAEYLDDFDEDEDGGDRVDYAAPVRKAVKKKAPRDDEEDDDEDEEEEEAEDGEMDDFIVDDEGDGEDEGEGESLGSKDTSGEEEDDDEGEDDEEGDEADEEVEQRPKAPKQKKEHKEKKVKKSKKDKKDKKDKARLASVAMAEPADNDDEEEEEAALVTRKKARNIFVESDEDDA